MSAVYNEYLARHRARMAAAPPDIHRFADANLCSEQRCKLVAWLRCVTYPSNVSILCPRLTSFLVN